MSLLNGQPISSPVCASSGGPFGAGSAFFNVLAGGADGHAAFFFPAGSNPFDFTSTPLWSADFLINPSASGRGEMPIWHTAQSGGQEYFYPSLDNSGRLLLSSHVYRTWTATGYAPLPLNQWSHVRICVRVNGPYPNDISTVFAYVGGALDILADGNYIDPVGDLETYLGVAPGHFGDFNLAELALFNSVLTAVPLGTALGTQVFTPPTAPFPDALNGLAHIYHFTTDATDTASQDFTLAMPDPAHPITLSTSGGTDTITVPTGAFTPGTYGIGGLALYEGPSEGAEGATAVATLNTASGAFTRPTASNGAKAYVVRALDGEPVPAAGSPSNEVVSRSGTALIGGSPDATRALRRTYVDPIHEQVEFGLVSYYMLGWRAVLDTVPAQGFAGSLGVNANVDKGSANDRLLISQYVDAGFRKARDGSSWGSDLDWDGTLTNANWATNFAAYKALGVRPLICLDTNNGNPVPSKPVAVNAVSAATAGSTTLVVDGTNIGQVRPYYTCFGFGAPMVSAVSGPDGSGHYTLTVPGGVPRDIAAGGVTLTDMRYSPLGTDGIDGSPSTLRAVETYLGWKHYVTVLCQLAYSYFGTPDDAGFDLEVENETFGMSGLFATYGISGWAIGGLPINNAVYHGTESSSLGRALGGADGLRGATCDAVAALGYKGVLIVNGLANGVPWYGGADLWPGEGANSRHGYTGGVMHCSPSNPVGNSHNWYTVDAQGGLQGTYTSDPYPRLDGSTEGGNWGTIIPGTNHIPAVDLAFPEQRYTFLGGTESLIRDTGTYVHPNLGTGYAGHSRFSRAPGSLPALYLETENNFERSGVVDKARALAGLDITHPAVRAFDERVAAKAVLRSAMFVYNKGQAVNYFFSMSNAYADGNLLELTPTGYDAAQGPSLVPRVVKRARQFLERDSTDFGVCRSLGVEGVTEYDPQLVWAGDPANQAGSPDMYNADFLAVLPYQASLRRFVLACYVAHPDMTKEWDTTRGALDLARYTMTPQRFEFTLTNIQGSGAAVRLYDPTSDTYETAVVLSSTATSLTVRVYLTDQPRLLEILEAQDGPALRSLQAVQNGDGTLSAAWQSPDTVTATGGADTAHRTAQALTVVGAGMGSRADAPAGVGALQVAATNGAGVTVQAPYYPQDTFGDLTFTELGALAGLLGIDTSALRAAYLALLGGPQQTITTRFAFGTGIPFIEEYQGVPVFVFDGTVTVPQPIAAALIAAGLAV